MPYRAVGSFASLRRLAALLGPTRVACAMGGLLMAGALLLGGWVIWDGYRQTRDEAERALVNIGAALEQDVARTVERYDDAMQGAAAALRLPGMQEASPELRRAAVRAGLGRARQAASVLVVDDRGELVFASDDDPQRWPAYVYRPWFTVQRDLPNAGLYVSRPFLSRDTWTRGIVFSRRVSRPDGGFAGVVATTVQLAWFQDLFSLIDLGQRGSVTLLSTDGVILARVPDGGPRVAAQVGQDIGAVPEFQRMKHTRAGVLDGPAALDGVDRIFAYRQVGDLPLFVVVASGRDEVLAPWRRKAAATGLILLTAVGLAGVLTLALRRQLRQRADAEAAALEAAAEAQRYAQERSEALARLNTLFVNSGDALFVVHAGEDGRFTYESVNPACERLSGLPAKATVGRTPHDCLPPEAAAAELARWRRCIEEKRPLEYLCTLDLPGGRRDWEICAAPVVEEDGWAERVVGVARDVTERNLLEARLRQAQRMEAMGQLTAGVAHDFNNMLQSVLGAIELLREQRGLDAQGRECVAIAHEAGSRGAMLVHRLLAFSRKQPLAPALLRPEEVVAGLAGLLARTLGANVQVDVEVDGAADGRGIWSVRADGAQLDNCLCNLAINGRDAMPDGGKLRLRLSNVGVDDSAAAGLPNGEYVRFDVADDGVGMTPEVLACAFEPFFTTKEVGKGTGLGLAMVQGFAIQSGGEVRLVSAPGRGTTVSLWLPRAVGVLDPIAAAPAPTVVPKGRGRVLVVDDVASVRRTLALFLERAGFVPVEAGSGKEALELLRRGLPCDLLVTDQSMPGLSGCDLILEAERLRPNLPSMLVTGFDAVSGLERLQGRVTVLRKPVTQAEFVQQAQTLLVEVSGAAMSPEAPGANVVGLEGIRAERSAGRRP